MLTPLRRRTRWRPPPAPPRRLPAAEHVHHGEHVLRLRLHRLLDARRVRHGRAVHRVRDRRRHARRPHRADDRDDERVRRRVRFAGRHHLVRRGARDPGVLVGPAAARPARAGRPASCSWRRRRCASRASTSRRDRRTSATSSACRAPRRPAIPAATVYAYPWGFQTYAEALPVLAMVIVPALLMVSTIRFRSFKNLDLAARRKYPVLLLVALGLALHRGAPRTRARRAGLQLPGVRRSWSWRGTGSTAHGHDERTD